MSRKNRLSRGVFLNKHALKEHKTTPETTFPLELRKCEQQAEEWLIEGERMSDDNRTGLAMMLWVMTGIALSALFISAAAAQSLTIMHMIIALIILAVSAGGTYVVWTVNFRSDDYGAKVKRERIDEIIKDLSDDELMALKRRLSDRDYTETSILDFLNEEGELVERR